MTDALKTYKAKRNFDVTPEPADGGEQGASLSFVIQKHWASRLHYDFRLELDGTMKSWAVPKGPSYDTKDKRMAVHVEDHPISYSSFEGTIPEHQYGAGKVVIWDKGTWQPLEEPHQAYAAGNLKFELHGHKMHGKWVLVRMKGKGEKQQPWLLIKEKDGFARPAAEFSVVDEMPDSVKALPPPTRAQAAGPAAARQGAAAPPAELEPVALPATLAPQLATLVDAAPTSAEDWLFELKFDGYRILSRIDGERVQLFTRNGHDWSRKLEPLRAALARMGLPCGWYDGEIVVHDEQGRPDFGLLQQAFDDESTAEIVYFLFDAPFLDGRDLRPLPLETRRALLQGALERAPQQPAVRFSVQLDAAPQDIVAAACKLGLEGVIGKRRGSPYVTRRSADWIKLKCGQRQEFVIGGYTDPQGGRTGIGSLLLGTYDERGRLRYAGNVGSGFNEAALRDLKRRLARLDSEQCPFEACAEIARKSHWVKPQLLAEVSFSEWTRGGSLRHAVFHGLRADKKPSAITREIPLHMEDGMDSVDRPGVKGSLPPGLKVSNPERLIDADSGTTKIGLVRYYALVGQLMLAHLKARPVSLVRAPSGVGGELFFQKHADSGKLPGVTQLDAALDPEHAQMLEVATLQGLLGAAQWNVVEFHTQNAFAARYETPNRIVFDLDPGKDVEWKAIQEGARLMRAMLDELGLQSFLKTSGGKGLHVVVPIKPFYGWDVVKAFSQAVVAHMAQTIPERFVLKSGPSNRVGKIFIDYLRNGRGATTVCAWSARARPGLGISVPLDWDELAAVKRGDQWTVATVHTRLDRGNEPWAAYAKSARSLTAAMKRLGFDPRQHKGD
ncbi:MULTISPECIES: DNA ligase D [unclassified Janthinobacterium]|uniref:DNA ligase D n=1 Tax=unclassified Janthinobacterium TaxID=2610881 RepID=UPI000346D4E0|nr:MULTISPECIES: DNA ligase D [unclassified Janthinobacterium]MEC5161177.1 bifunctional non-homologous end joining protein LigD [Janthinobacterium sp. CG_S6]